MSAQPGTPAARRRVLEAVERLWDEDLTEGAIATLAGITRDSLRRRRENPALWMAFELLDLAIVRDEVWEAIVAYRTGTTTAQDSDVVRLLRDLASEDLRQVDRAMDTLADNNVTAAEALEHVLAFDRVAAKRARAREIMARIAGVA